MTIITELIAAGAELKTKNFENNSCILLLCKNSNCNIEEKLRLIQILRTDIYQLNDIKNIYGKSAWDCWSGIKFYDHPQVINLLKLIKLKVIFIYF